MLLRLRLFGSESGTDKIIGSPGDIGNWDFRCSLLGLSLLQIYSFW